MPSRRRVLQTLLHGALIGATPAFAAQRVRHIAPDGVGDGADWARAAPFERLDDMVRAVGPGGVVNLRADPGDVYRLGARGVALRSGGAPSAPVIVRGLRSDGAAGFATLEGDRTPWERPSDAERVTDVRGWTPGAPLIRLHSGAGGLVFERLDVRRAGAAIQCMASCAHLVIRDCRGFNVRRWFEMTRGVSANHVVIERLGVVGFSKQAIRCRGDSHDWRIRDVRLDSARQDGDDFAVGIQFDDTAHDVLVQGAELSNCHDSLRAYHNGDGGSSELGNYGIEWRDVRSYGHTDAGLDNKGACVYRNVECWDNKVGLRFWTRPQEAHGVVVRDSRLRGGSGRPALIGVYGAPGPHVTINDLTARESGAGTAFLLAGADARVDVHGHRIDLSDGATMTHVAAEGRGARLRLDPPI
ncbi:MAG TPA: hypothetical protein VIL72_03495 [Beijerinckiaceae bacterium]|jgi:hypothetical protein